MATSNPGPAITTGDINTGESSPWVGGASITSLIGFYGSTPIARQASASQAAVVTSATATTTVLRAQLTATAVLANALRAALVNLNLIKGAA